jgi:hypothetical protein
MSARGVKLINGKQPLLRQIVFEVKYHHGYNYLDRCGKILNRITKENAEWVVGNQVNPQNAPLFSMRNECKFIFGALGVNFHINKTNSDGIITNEDVNDFSIQCEEMTNLVIDELNLTEFSRIGFRVWYYFPCDSKEDSDKWMRDLNAFKLSPDLTSAFGGELESLAVAVFITGADSRFRMGFETYEAPVQFHAGPEVVNIRTSMLRGSTKDVLKKHLKERHRLEINAKYGAVVDFDSFQEDPLSIDPRDFINGNFSLFKIRLYDVLSPTKND